MPAAVSSEPWIMYWSVRLGVTLHFIDDILVYSPNPEQHVRDFHETLNTLREAGLTVNEKKCKFFKSEVKFLGFLVNGDGICIDPQKYEANIFQDQQTSKL